MDEEVKVKTKKKRRKLPTVVLIIILLVGLCVLLYPTVANWWNSKVQTKAIDTYNEAVEDLTEEARAELLAEAKEYNKKLAEVGSGAALANPDIIDGYWDTLDVSGTGVMGYITIDKINVRLPIYHGTDASVLQVGAGHLQGTSLPVGGESTHSVISAHRGLPSARLFTDLPQLEEGDTFVITTVDETLTYVVDQITIVLPTELDNIYIQDGEDYVTLMTCTPYGVNTHRLLVRGVRTDNAAAINIDAEAYKVNALIVAPFIAIPFVVILLIWLFVSTRRHKKRIMNK